MSKMIFNGLEFVNGVQINELYPICYDTDEREVGCWIDGKPLYQKTWDFGNAITVNSNAWTDTSISNSDIEAIVKVVGGNLFSGKITCFDGLSATADSGSVVKILQNRNIAISVRYLTLQYTKTTDVAGSGTWNSQGQYAHHYSEDEKVVGTWIDGKPLYEKTIEFDTGVVASNIDFIITSYMPSDCEVVDVSFIITFVYDGQHYRMVNKNGGYWQLDSVHYFTFSIGSAQYDKHVEMTIQYTKTTD